MPIFHRNRTPMAAPPSGLRCHARDCPSDDATACGYRDRRGRECRTAFCAEHSVVVDDVQYCRRHAGTMRALGSRGRGRAGLPDVDNRGPSLVQHVANQLEAPVSELLHGVARPQEQVIEEPEITKSFDPDRSSRWERSWRLVDGTGVVVKVTVFVTEGRPAALSIRVGSHVVFEEVPPWVSQHERGEAVTPEEDLAERRRFFTHLEETISHAVGRVREDADHPVWVR